MRGRPERGMPPPSSDTCWVGVGVGVGDLGGGGDERGVFVCGGSWGLEVVVVVVVRGKALHQSQRRALGTGRAQAPVGAAHLDGHVLAPLRHHQADGWGLLLAVIKPVLDGTQRVLHLRWGRKID